MSLIERKEVSEYIVDETVLKVGSENIWIWVATEPENGQFSHKPYLRKETCLWQKGSCQALSETMGNMLYLWMEVRGIHKPVNF